LVEEVFGAGDEAVGERLLEVVGADFERGVKVFGHEGGDVPGFFLDEGGTFFEFPSSETDWENTERD